MRTRAPVTTPLFPVLVAAGLVPAALLWAACASAPADKPYVPPDRPRATVFVPLAVGNAWTYKVTPSAPNGPPLRVEILQRDTQGFYVDNQGRRLAPRTDGVFDGARFLVQEPVEAGHTWMSIPERGVVEKYRVVSTGEACASPAGQWTRCLVVEATQDLRPPEVPEPVTMTAAWTYAPNVGMVHFVQLVAAEGRAPQKTAEYVLVDYQVAPATDDAAPPIAGQGG